MEPKGHSNLSNPTFGGAILVSTGEEPTPWLIATSGLHVDEENGMRPTQERQPPRDIQVGQHRRPHMKYINLH